MGCRREAKRSGLHRGTSSGSGDMKITPLVTLGERRSFLLPWHGSLVAPHFAMRSKDGRGSR